MGKYLVALIGGTTIVLGIRHLIIGAPQNLRLRALHYCAGTLLLYGCIGFFGQALAATGGLWFIGSSVEWPVSWPEASTSDSRGQTIVALASVGRVQVYNSEGHFQRGWFVDASGGMFVFRTTPADQVEVFAQRGNRRLLYSASGELLDVSEYAPRDYEIVRTETPSPTFNIGTPWLLWPLASPFIAWAVCVVGMIGEIATQRLAKRLVRS